MKKLTYILSFLFLFFILPNTLFGQRIKKLKALSSWEKNDIYLQLKHLDSIKQTVVYLINRSGKDQEFYGTNGRFHIYPEANNLFGEWINIDHRITDCLTGIKYTALPKDHFSWQRKDYPTGDFKTKIRYTVILKDTIIYSKPFIANIPSYSFGTQKEYLIGHYDTKLKNINLSDSARIFNMLRKASVYTTVFKDFDNAIITTKQCIELYPNSVKAHFLLGKFYLRKLNICREGITEEEFQVTISACFEQLTIAHKLADFKNDEIKTAIKKYSKHFKKVLPIESKWNLNNKLDCIEVDGKIKCFEKCLTKDYVGIKFQN
jgi:tetratricopeptide (TPR) repeat protein